MALPLARILVGWAIATGIGCLAVERAFAVDVDDAHPRVVVASVWSRGQLVGRATLARAGDRDPRLDVALESHEDATLVYESVVGEGAVPATPEAAFALSFVPGRDGIAATLGDRTEYVTPDDLLVHQAYDKGVHLPGLGVTGGVDLPVALAMLGDRFDVTVRDLLDHAAFRRVRIVRSLPGRAQAPVVTAESLSRQDARGAALAAGGFLARGVDSTGRFRYVVDAPTNRTMPGYDWPRHAGATYFLAQAAALADGAQRGELGSAALRAASFMRDHAMVACGPDLCVGDESVVDVGSAALAVLAFAEIAKTKLDPDYALLVPRLTAFLRAQEKADGEFMHRYDRTGGHPIDVQLLYYSGEAALALSRANSLLGDPRDLDGATRALAHLVGPGWRFFGSRYYFGEEHWTCQAMDDLWDRSPDRDALDFCARWQAYGRKLQHRRGETLYDAEGAYGLDPVLTPRLTPVASRCEAAIATLDAGVREGLPPGERNELDAQIRRSLALLLRHQLRGGAEPLLTDPAAVEGAMPASAVDWQLRIDFAQHMGSALIRWLNQKDANP